MKELAEAFLREKHEGPWCYDKTARELFCCLFHGELYQGDYHPHIRRILKTKTQDLTLLEIQIYLTALAKGDRLNEGIFDDSIHNGLIAQLLTRWLELSDEEKSEETEP